MKHFNLKTLMLGFVIMIMNIFITSLYAQQKIEKDIYGREIKNSKGDRVNYSRAESESLTLIQNYEPLLKSAQIKSSNSELFKDTVHLNTQNLFSIVGTSIGRKSMHSLDINADDTLDLICTGSLNTFGGGNFWYVLNFNQKDSTYKHVWTSSEYEHNITVLEVVDINNDSNYTIVLGFSNGNLEFYDAASKELLRTASPVNEDINSIVFADADNDGVKEIVISSDSKTCILNATTLDQEFEISNGANEVRVGNVDTNEHNEIVLSSGTVYLLNNNVLTTVWNYTSSTGGIIELSDIDGDTYLEIVYAERWYYIKVYDVNTKTTKYTINSDLDIHTLLLQDINNDNVDEIIYGDAQWGDVHCHNSVTQAKIWSIRNPEHGVSAVNFADLDSDGEEELIWGAGWTSTGEDYLYVYDVDNDSLEWQSSDIVGPFYALATGDVDGDHQDDIVAVSYESESGYGSGVILIIDAVTKEVKWESSGDFLYLVWTGIYDVAISDIDKDGQNEIIIAAGDTYDGKIWIIDGKLKTIESSYEFPYSTDIDEFYALEVEDVDDDNTIEIIASTSSGIYVINPTDWSVEWEVAITGGSYSKPTIECADVTGNGKKEIIVCKGSINIINTDDHSLWSSSETDFLNIDTIDYNQDGTTDILASTSNGEIIILDGNSKIKLLEIQPENSSILSVKAIRMGDSLMYVYSCEGRINYYINEDKRIVSQFFANKTAELEGLKFLNIDDGQDLLIGTSISILQISGNTFKCTEMEVGIEKNEVSCDITDGKIKLAVTGGSLPYSYTWNDNSTIDSLCNVAPGSYFVIVEDISGCSKKRHIELTEAYISANIEVLDEGCLNKGSAKLNINHATEPYNITWSNGFTAQYNSELIEGEYSVIMTDAKNCSFSDTIEIKKDTVIIDEYIKDVSCYGDSSGYIQISVISGANPIIFDWDHGASGSHISNLEAGIYKVMATDTMGCKAELEIAVNQPDEITYEILTSPDIASTPIWEGKIIIDNINGGTQPYDIYWPEYSKSSHYIDVLPVGTYEFILTDGNACQILDSAIISSYTSTFEIENSMPFNVYPNPVKDKLYFSSTNTDLVINNIELINTSGKLVLQKSIDVGQNMIDLIGLLPGVYVLKVTTINSGSYEKIIIKR